MAFNNKQLTKAPLAAMHRLAASSHKERSNQGPNPRFAMNKQWPLDSRREKKMEGGGGRPAVNKLSVLGKLEHKDDA